MNDRGPTFLTILDEVRRRWRRVAWLRVMTRVLLVAAVAVVLLAIMDRTWAPTTDRLARLTAIIGVVVAAAAVYCAWPYRRRPTDRDVARLVEERCPECEERLVSAIDAGPSALRTLLEDDATRVASRLDLEQIVSASRVRAAAGGAALALVALLAIGVASQDAVTRAARAVWFAVWPPTITVRVTPGDARIAMHDPLTIQAHISGVPHDVELAVPELRVRSGAARHAERMTRSNDGRFEIRIPKVTRGFTYRVTAGRLASDEYRVDALPRPHVTRIDVDYKYPSFTGLEPRVVEDSGDVYAPAGTEIRLRVHANKSLSRATFVRTDAERTTPMRVVTETVAEMAFTLDGNGAYRVALRDRDGLDSPGDTEFFLRVVDDRPPEVRVIRPEGDRAVTRLEEVAIEARADDDYGVEQFELVYAVRGHKEQRVRLGSGQEAKSADRAEEAPRDQRRTSVTGRHTLFLEDLDVQPGDFISYYARAVDVGRGKRPTEARSDIFFLEVRPFSEEFAAAQSQAMAMSGAGGGLEDLAAAQKDLIIATWKLDRRSAGGRSAADIRSLGRAQAELRDQAARQAARAALGRLGGRRGNDEGEESARPPIARAAEAMSHAADALANQQTARALPHEMEAYNELLRADAEVRRRLVARQQGGGGGGRSGTEDLSALFDRELLREQTTNYAQQSTANQAQEARESSALERLRELARRQDDLARAQRDLARQRGPAAEEEIKRRLERLTREQEELQRQAMQLARELDQERSADGSQANEGSNASSGSNESQGAAGGQEARGAESESAGGQGARGETPESARGGSTRGEEPESARNGENARRDESSEARSDQQTAARASRPASSGGAEAARETRAGTGQLTEALQRALEDMRRATRGLREADVGEAASRSEESLARLREAERALGGTSARRDEASERLAEQLARAQRVRERLAEIDQRLAEADRERSGQRDGQPSQAQNEQGNGDRRAQGQGAERGAQSGSGNREAGNGKRESGSGNQESGSGNGRSGASPSGRETAGESRGSGAGRGDELAELGAEREQLLREARSLVDEAGQQNSEGAAAGGTPEHQEFSRSAPGTEAFKQDFSRWDALRKEVMTELETLELALSEQLAERDARNRLNAGGDERAPERYRDSVARYYRSIAKKPGPGG
ncbi:MAG: DUF4175 family protein [Luteitalea sp.]|nr:DUF4175 family protein [Luteitalea sp.]